jgi:hypothetical protein
MISGDRCNPTSWLPLVENSHIVSLLHEYLALRRPCSILDNSIYPPRAASAARQEEFANKQLSLEDCNAGAWRHLPNPVTA